MTPLERDIQLLVNKIEESEKKSKTLTWNGPVVTGLAGFVIILISLIIGFDARFFFIGLVIVLSAVIWAYVKSREMQGLKKSIFSDKMRLYTLKKKL